MRTVFRCHEPIFGQTILRTTVSCLLLAPASLLAESNSKEQQSTPVRNNDESSVRKNTPSDVQQSRWGLGLGFVLPPMRPAVTLSYTMPFASVETSARISGSYLSLAKVFKDAAVDSQYADKLASTEAYLWDLTTVAPEVAVRFPLSLYASVAPVFRLTRCVANYSTTAQEPLIFSGWGLSAGIAAEGGLRRQLMSQNLTLEIAGYLQWPFTSFGEAELNFQKAVESGSETFSDQDLDSVLNSLHPYMKDITNQPTAGLSLRASWRF